MESISQNCRAGSLRKVGSIRIRPVREWESCIVYTPDNPALFMLSKRQWLILEIANSQTVEQIAAEYSEILEADGATDECVSLIGDLVGSGILEFAPE